MGDAWLDSVSGKTGSFDVGKMKDPCNDGFFDCQPDDDAFKEPQVIARAVEPQPDHSDMVWAVISFCLAFCILLAVLIIYARTLKAKRKIEAKTAPLILKI